MNKVAHAFLTTLFFAVLTMLTAIAWSNNAPAPTPASSNSIVNK